MLTAAERAAIKALCKLDPALHQTEVNNWNAAADALATTEVKPSPRTNFGAPVETEGRKEMALVFPNKDIYKEWAGKMTNDSSSVMSKRFTVDAYAFSKIGTPWQVVGGKAIDNMENVTFATWHEDKCETRKVKGSRLEGAKSRYEELGLNTYLNKEWDNIVSNKSPWTVVYVKGHFTWKTKDYPAANTYMARDHYGLIADGTGIGYVTLIENDNPDTTQVSEGLPVQMHVIKVVPELYADGIAVLTDSMNKLSEKLTLLYRTPLGSTSDKYEFQWCYTTPETDGTVPDKGTASWKDKALETGLVSVQLGENGANLQDYVNTVHYRAQRIQRKSDPMIGHTALTEIISTDLSASVPRSHLGFSLGRDLIVLAPLLLLIEACAEQAQRFFLIAQLTALILTLDHDAGRLMDQADCRQSFVDMLSAGAGAFHRLDLQIGLVDLHLHVLHLGKHRHGGRRRLESPGRFGYRNSLDPVSAALKLETGIGTVSADEEGDLLVSAQFRFVDLGDLASEAVSLRIHYVHTVQVGGKQSRLFPARAGTDLHNHVFIVVGILRDQHLTELLLQIGKLLPQSVILLFCHLSEIGIALRMHHMFRIGHLSFGIRHPTDHLHHGAKGIILFHHGAVFGRIR